MLGKPSSAPFPPPLPRLRSAIGPLVGRWLSRDHVTSQAGLEGARGKGKGISRGLLLTHDSKFRVLGDEAFPAGLSEQYGHSAVGAASRGVEYFAFTEFGVVNDRASAKRTRVPRAIDGLGWRARRCHEVGVGNLC